MRLSLKRFTHCVTSCVVLCAGPKGFHPSNSAGQVRAPRDTGRLATCPLSSLGAGPGHLEGGGRLARLSWWACRSCMHEQPRCPRRCGGFCPEEGSASDGRKPLRGPAHERKTVPDTENHANGGAVQSHRTRRRRPTCAPPSSANASGTRGPGLVGQLDPRGTPI